jgi:hypothetical protein
MIDKKAKREELIALANKAQKVMADTRDQINYLNGALTLLNELIADEEGGKNENTQNNA